jgi:RNA polymerase sigma factor (sigma-70 family)
VGCRRGDPAAWETLVGRYERLVFALARGYGLDSHAAADVAQSVFAVLLGSLDRLWPDTRMAAWLGTVARRHIWRLLHHRSREPLLGDGVPPTDLEPASEDRHATRSWVSEALLRLDGRCRELVEALYLRPDEPSYAQIAADLGMPIGSIGPTRSRCLERLRRLLEASDRDGAPPRRDIGSGET